MSNYDEYQEYSTNQEYRNAMEFFNEHYVFLNDYPILVCGDSQIVDFNDKDIYFKDGCMLCGKGNNRKWREFRNEKADGTRGDPYIMTFDELVYTFGDYAKSVFDEGEVSDEW